jgi:hypothetical protein
MVDEIHWHIAQAQERLQHTMEQKQAIEHYRKSYSQYFAHLGIDTDLSGRCIAEIGPADVPGLFYCVGTEKSFVVEPMPSDILPTLGVKVRKAKAENVDYSKVDEVWLFNVLQHVQDPQKIVQKVKKAKRVRWFEPVDQGTDACHLHNLTHDMFIEWFGMSNRYIARPDVQAFHTATCSYGVYDNVR